MTIRDIDNAARNDGKQPIFVTSRGDSAVYIKLNNILRSYETFMQMPVYGLFSGVVFEAYNNSDRTVNCFFITVDAPMSVLKAWEQEGRE